MSRDIEATTNNRSQPGASAGFQKHLPRLGYRPDNGSVQSTSLGSEDCRHTSGREFGLLT
jgi:hypothetical protein